MAKTNCAKCGKEIGLVQQVQLADRQYLCRECAKEIMPLVDHLDITYDDYLAHVKQNADGQILYDAYFKKNRKVKKNIAGHVLYDPDTALICITDKKGLFGQAYYNVFRVADLDLYEKATSFTKGFEGRNVPADSICITFRNVQGVGCYLIPSNDDAIKNMEKHFDEVFNGKGIISRMKASQKKNQDQIMAAGGIAQGLKAAFSGDALKTGEADEALINGAAQVAANIDATFYAGREDLMQRADAAIKAALG